MKLQRIDILICFGSGCVSAGAAKIKTKLIEVLKEKEILNEVNIIETGCMGPCDYAPVMMIYPEGVFYRKLTIEDVTEIVEEHLIKGRPVTRLMVQEADNQFAATKKDIPFYQKQVKVALENCGYLNPESVNEYIALGGYEAFGKAISELTPEQAIEVVEKSGLRGRGGGGFPTGLKWKFARQNKRSPKYLICNADEGDPGAFMDRSLLEGDPHRILEGMMLAAYAVGAEKGFFYIRAEYPLAIKRIIQAVEQAHELGLLGENIFDTKFSFDVEVRSGAGAFVCGEETALIASIEGRRGEPNPKPPYPSDFGLWGMPTVVNNVETLANLPAIFLKGAEWFASYGTENSKGTKVFALTGDVKNTGLVEVPMGISLREIIYDVGGGIVEGKRFKAVQLGGPSGGCLTSEHLDVKIDYESLKEKGSMMGSGGIIVMDDSNCMVNIAKFFLEFSVEESCGKCVPCRVGLKEMYEILSKITEGRGTEKDIDKLEELGKMIKTLSLCGLGQSAPNPVLSTIRYFRQEYLSHVHDKSCQSAVCTTLFHFLIDKEKCIGCSLCSRKCPVSCIPGSREEKYEITQIDCIKCGTCMEVCPVNAISKIPGIAKEVLEARQQEGVINSDFE
jgi:NADH:ubiquinone oxidoreductase subunit F (NADH-binding)/(2Fe-2S) ferredoxin